VQEKYDTCSLALGLSITQKWYLNFYSLEVALQFNKVFPNPEQIDSRSYPSKPSDERVQDTADFCDIAKQI